jgi:hypothetical protein
VGFVSIYQYTRDSQSSFLVTDFSAQMPWSVLPLSQAEIFLLGQTRPPGARPSNYRISSSLVAGNFPSGTGVPQILNGTTDNGFVPRQMVEPFINEVSGVDYPAHLVNSWLLMKSANPTLTPEMVSLLAKAEAESMGVDLPADFEEIVKRAFTQAQRDAAEKKGHAMEGGGFPINTVADLHNAIRSLGRAKDPAAAKAHIIQQARRLGAISQLPDDWGVSKEAPMPLTEEVRKALPAEAQEYLTGLENQLSRSHKLVDVIKAAGHAFVPDPDDDSDDPDCQVCGDTESEGDHMSKAVSGSRADTAELERQAFEKALGQLPEPVRKHLLEEQRKAAEAQAMAKALFDERENRKYEEMAKALQHLPGITGEKFGPVLRKAAEADPGSFTPLYEALKAADSALKASGAFSEIGTGTTTEGVGGSPEASLDGVAKGLMAADASLSYPEAIAKAVSENPDLYNQHRHAALRRNATLEG